MRFVTPPCPVEPPDPQIFKVTPKSDSKVTSTGESLWGSLFLSGRSGGSRGHGGVTTCVCASPCGSLEMADMHSCQYNVCTHCPCCDLSQELCSGGHPLQQQGRKRRSKRESLSGRPTVDAVHHQCRQLSGGFYRPLFDMVPRTPNLSGY